MTNEQAFTACTMQWLLSELDSIEWCPRNIPNLALCFQDGRLCVTSASMANLQLLADLANGSQVVTDLILSRQMLQIVEGSLRSDLQKVRRYIRPGQVCLDGHVQCDFDHKKRIYYATNAAMKRRTQRSRCQHCFSHHRQIW